MTSKVFADNLPVYAANLASVRLRAAASRACLVRRLSTLGKGAAVLHSGGVRVPSVPVEEHAARQVAYRRHREEWRAGIEATGRHKTAPVLFYATTPKARKTATPL